MVAAVATRVKVPRGADRLGTLIGTVTWVVPSDAFEGRDEVDVRTDCPRRSVNTTRLTPSTAAALSRVCRAAVRSPCSIGLAISLAINCAPVVRASSDSRASACHWVRLKTRQAASRTPRAATIAAVAMRSSKLMPKRCRSCVAELGGMKERGRSKQFHPSAWGNAMFQVPIRSENYFRFMNG